MLMKICILGCGAYGIALSLMFNENNNNIIMWTKFKEEKDDINKKRENDKVLKGVKIPDNIIITDDMKEAVKEYCDFLDAGGYFKYGK